MADIIDELTFEDMERIARQDSHDEPDVAPIEHITYPTPNETVEDGEAQ